MNRLPLPLLFVLLAVAVIASAPFRHAQAANDLDKWNSDTGRVVRSTLKEKVATTTYKEMPNVVDAEYRSTSNGGKVLHRIEHAATQSGSKVGTTIEALKQVDKAAVAKKWANQIFKGGVRFTAGAVLIEVAMQEMLDGLDWIMNEGSQVTKPSEQTDFIPPRHPSTQYYYTFSGYEGATRDDAARAAAAAVSPQSYLLQPCSFKNGNWSCTVMYIRSGQPITSITDRVYQYPNPNYVAGTPSPTPEPEILTKQQVESGIKDYLNTSSKASKDLLIQEAYKPTGKASIEWSDDPDSRVEIFGDTPDIAKRVYDSDNPVADGLTKTTPKITDGTTVSGETTPNPNPESPTITDPETGQSIPNPNYDPNYDSGSTTTTKLPSACEYFAKLCDWMDWTQDPPDLPENSEVEIKDQDLINYQYADHIKFIASCPFSPRMEIFPMGILGDMNVEVDFSYFCEIATMMKAVVIFLSAFIAVMMLSYAAKDL